MQNKPIKGLFMLIFSFLLLVSAQFSINASENEFEISVSPEEDYYTASIYIKAPDKLTDINISLYADGNQVEIAEFITDGSDTQKLSGSSLEANVGEETVYFTYFSEETTEHFSFSGYFLNSYTSEEDFFIGKIRFDVSEEIQPESTVTVIYSLSCEHGTKSETETYFLLSGKNTVANSNNQYPCGDADMNGTVSAADARTILRASVGLEKLDFLTYPYANCDYDGKISASDARFALRASVGLEETVYHSFSASLGDGATCERGGEYTFTCSVTHKSFSTNISEGQHIKENTGCFNTGKCVICNNTVFPAASHSFNDSGVCKTCGAIKETIEKVSSELIPVMEAISSYDFLAHEASDRDDKEGFIKNTLLATAEIKKAAEKTRGINGMQTIYNHLETAYSIRFEAIMKCTDGTGKIRLNTSICNILEQAIKESNKHIDYASYLDI